MTTTASILENELVKKYFTCPKEFSHRHQNGWPQVACLSYNVLRAMQQPIRKGEAYLNQANRNDWIEMTDSPRNIEGWHLFALRLPDAFQPKGALEDSVRCQHECGEHPSRKSIDPGFDMKPPSEVEARVLEIRDLYAKEKLDDNGPVVRVIYQKLVELVALARAGK